MPTFRPIELIELCDALFQACSVPPAGARIVAESLVTANLCGHDSHGVMRAPQYVQFLQEGKYQADAKLTILQESPAILAADAGWGLGQIQAHELLSRLIPKAKVLGVASGTLRNCGHTGRLGEYAEVAAKHHLALFATVNSHGAGRRVAPPNGTEGRISTNPICFGVPTAKDPIVLDFGTSAVAEGKVRVHFQKQEPTPEGWLTDHLGEPTNDPAVLYTDPRGSIVPFGGAQAYKGFGLGLLLDMLAGGLSGGRCSNPNDPMAGIGNTMLMTLYNPAAFGGVDAFLEQSTGLADFVQTCPTRPGTTITLPGDPERQCRKQRETTGIAIPDGTWKLIAETAERLQVNLPSIAI